MATVEQRQAVAPGAAEGVAPGALQAVADFPHGRVPREVRHRQILDVAGELFAERGYHGASMAELARRVGVSKPVIYDLFGSKEELFRVVCEHAADAIERELATTVTAQEEPAGRLRAGAAAAFEIAARHRRAAEVLFPEAGGRFADTVGYMRRRWARLVAALLADDLARRGRSADQREVEAVAHAVGGAFEALALWWRDHPEVEAETLTEWFVALTRPGLERLGSDPEDAGGG